jgi:predicted ArsR family transcriptional regulator
MKGLTIKEMAEALKIEPNTVKQRLFQAGIKPITKDALYDEAALEAIRNVPGKGRPPKAKQPGPTKKPKKS